MDRHASIFQYKSMYLNKEAMMAYRKCYKSFDADFKMGGTSENIKIKMGSRKLFIKHKIIIDLLVG
ncbi:hypothetical protein NQ317_012529 [Molorchus minor]|uniref:Uncharacterized protein n=1 Tax=Molorchus minor TaxID=1323400 RepID=A0ABQ9K242_9CUCU|nr:hypothetical protein NQ317_012529 [Molorchus minor]